MSKLQDQVKEFMLAAGQECPVNPTGPSGNTRILRAKLILEEALEYCEAAGIDVFVNRSGEPANFCLSDLDFYDTGKCNIDLVGVADAAADLLIVVQGMALSFGFDTDPIVDAVHENNITKFIDGYKAVDLKPIVKSQNPDKDYLL